MPRRFAYLDILRVMSVMLVMYGHFVSVGGGGKIYTWYYSSRRRITSY